MYEPIRVLVNNFFVDIQIRDQVFLQFVKLFKIINMYYFAYTVQSF